MTTPSLTERERTLLQELTQLCAERATAGPDLERQTRERQEALQRAFDDEVSAAADRFSAARDAADRELKAATEAIATRYEAERQAAAEDYAVAKRKARGRYAKEKDAVKTSFQETQWTLSALLEAKRTEAENRLKEVQAEVAASMTRLQAIRAEAAQLLADWRQPPEFLDGSLLAAPIREGRRYRKLPSCLRTAERQLERLRGLTLPRYSKGWRLPVIVFGLWILSIYPAYLWFGVFFGLVGSGLAAALLGVLAEWILSSVARSQVLRVCLPLARALVEAEPSRRRVLDHYNAQYHRDILRSKRDHNRELRRAHERYKEERAAAKLRRAKSLALANEMRERRVAANEFRRADDTKHAERAYRRRCDVAQQQFDAESEALQERHRREQEELQAAYESRRQSLEARWRQGIIQARKTIAEVVQTSADLFPGWDEPAWTDWTPPRELPPGVRFGELDVRPELLPGGEVEPFTLPAVCPFPEGGSVILQAADDGRERAVDVLRTLMFRLLTSVPPGKARFTIIDPVSLGQNFAGFMHLADYDEATVGGRIWTEQSHIEHRLADLTAHMENVIQKYLRNQYASIQEYNEQAGEVAEPFRFLVAANFPANFSAEAVRRLVSIAQTGPRCGVYVLVTVDPRLGLPVGFDLAELERGAVRLNWDGRGFVWDDADFGPYPLRLDPPPPDALGMRALHTVGERAREARRVEVPFEFIAPPPEQYWTADSRNGLSVPLGRAGATKRQHLQLGHGTAQHVLVAGKTGSGKSTLLHALITNLSLLYSPDEVELYLVDFKKGVEFKTYAAHELPNARVIAIESEREFGLSVLQRLDAELKRRGDLFRAAGVQDLAGYRQARPDEALPRILLIVDEFQEFFTEDDRIAQDAAQLLDRLVRQGRAFGLHVLLGSQTLGGAYSLARSTIDQMAVRIALQCSEADAQLILSDDNAAARLLSRPGEAIYNDANGLVEGNNPFQVVWLSDERREVYLERVQELARRRVGRLLAPLVFEGNAPADPSRNPFLDGLLGAPAWPTAARAVTAWLGDAVAIKDPTAATFRPQGGNNLLVVGQQDEAALGMLATALVALAAQLPPADQPGPAASRFYVLDGSPADAPHHGLLARLADVVPHPVRAAGWRDLPAVLNELSDELARRQATEASETVPLFLVIYGLQRFRDLRRSEDDYGFTRRDGERPSPSQQFADLLREGATLGIHTLLWCDSLTNVQRSLDRQGLREFEMRVLFQMSVADSSNLSDTPLAARLGMYRALFYSEEQGRLEKFRPYGVPSNEWLAKAREALRGRNLAVSEV